MELDPSRPSRLARVTAAAGMVRVVIPVLLLVDSQPARSIASVVSSLVVWDRSRWEERAVRRVRRRLRLGLRIHWL